MKKFIALTIIALGTGIVACKKENVKPEVATISFETYGPKRDLGSAD
ncbi:hypothetical protein [Mucilaginibacter pocheonensis]|uniref:Uncharacterized protein n=1 Tax=Mucilaginibacter pocheonensis TaxID=398050 RepID=A0ABU1TGU4_9SPHI|nr:hypothetical protein [Mucilaginibacter pocheonensis]MDR6944479.1 hypothetical protein [Mucilaginibacter pocheonensis]